MCDLNSLGRRLISTILVISAVFEAYTVHRVNRLMQIFALILFPAFERLRSTRSLASFLRKLWYALFTSPYMSYSNFVLLHYYTYAGDADAA